MKPTECIRLRRIAPLALLFILMMPLVASGAAFLKFDGVDGESRDARHQKWIDVESFSFGAQLTTSIIGGGGGAGKPTIHELTIVKPMDSTSPKLFESCVIGRTFPTVELSVVRDSPNREPYLKVRLNDVLVSSYSTGGTGDTVPTEQLSLNFTKIEFAYIRYDDKGTSSTVSATYDVIKNTIKTAADQSVMQLP